MALHLFLRHHFGGGSHILGLLDTRKERPLHRLYLLDGQCHDRGWLKYRKSVRIVSLVNLVWDLRLTAPKRNTWQQIILFLLIIIGSSIFVSIGVLHIRKSAFERKLEELAERKRRRLGLRTLTFSLSKRKNSNIDPKEAAIASGVLRGNAIVDPDPEATYEPTFAARTRTRSINELLASSGEPPNGDVEAPRIATSSEHITFGDQPHPLRQTTSRVAPLKRRRSLLSNTGVATPSNLNHPRYAQPVYHEDNEEAVVESRPRSSSLARLNHYLEEFSGLIGRNSQFHHLSEKERRLLGGLEYDAICVLSWLVPLYFILFQLLGAIGVGAWLQINRPGTTLTNGWSAP
jgi:hypothetical protein